MSIQTITVPAQTFSVLDRPLTPVEALARMDADGHVAAVVAVPLDLMVDPEGDYDTFYDGLCARLIDDVDPYGLDYEVVGIAADRQSLYVRITQDMGALLGDVVAVKILTRSLRVPAEVVDDAFARLVA